MSTLSTEGLFRYSYPRWPARRGQATSTAAALLLALYGIAWTLCEGVGEATWCWVAVAALAAAHLVTEQPLRRHRSRVNYVRVGPDRLTWRLWPYPEESVALDDVQAVELSTPPEWLHGGVGRHLCVHYRTGTVDLGGEAELPEWSALAVLIARRCRLTGPRREAFGVRLYAREAPDPSTARGAGRGTRGANLPPFRHLT